MEMYSPEIPDLPVHPEVAARIPADIPGKLPTTYQELADWAGLPPPAPGLTLPPFLEDDDDTPEG